MGRCQPAWGGEEQRIARMRGFGSKESAYPSEPGAASPVKGLILELQQGNLLSDGLFSYTYDSANRPVLSEVEGLTEVVSGTLTTEYLYNGDGVRVAQIEAGLRTDYVQDVAAPLPQVLTARQGGTVSKYLRGLGLIGEQQGGTGPQAGSAVWQYYLPDALGSVRQVTDPTGQVLLTRRYDPFGGLQTASGIIHSNYGFAGEEQDPASDQLFLRARTYNPTTGRFLQADPVLGQLDRPASLHRYAYAFNNPVNLVDPSGQMPPGLGATQAHRYAPTFGSPALPDINYASPPPTQRSSGYTTPVNPWTASRSVNAAEAARSTYSDPYARQQSQGHLPKPCGLGDILFGLANSALNGNLLHDAFELAMITPTILQPLMQTLAQLQFNLDWNLFGPRSLLAGPDTFSPDAISDWLTGQFEDAKHIIQHADWRMAGSLAFGASTAFIIAGLAASGIGLPLLVVAGVGTAVANSFFNSFLYGDLTNLRTNLMTDLFSEGAESLFQVIGSAFGPAGSFVGGLLGAGVGQVINNYLSHRPWDEGLLAMMAFSGLAEGVGGAAGHGVSRQMRGALDGLNNSLVNRLRQLGGGLAEAGARARSLVDHSPLSQSLRQVGLGGSDQFPDRFPNLKRQLQELGLKPKQTYDFIDNLQKYGVTQDELQYIDDAVGGKLDHMLSNVECYGAALCLPGKAYGINLIPDDEGYIFRTIERSDLIGALARDRVPELERTGVVDKIRERQLNNLKLVNEYFGRDEFIQAIEDGELRPGDLIIYTDLSKKFEGQVVFDNLLKDIVPEHLPVHGNRFLGEIVLNEDVRIPIFFNKTKDGLQYPFEIIDLDQVFKVWNPTSIRIYRTGNE